MNEALFRDMNERVEERVRTEERDDEPFAIVCECGNIDCLERIRLKAAEYDATHAHPAQFVVVEGHVAPDVEDVVARNERYVVVRKRGVRVRSRPSSTTPVPDGTSPLESDASLYSMELRSTSMRPRAEKLPVPRARRQRGGVARAHAVEVVER